VNQIRPIAEKLRKSRSLLIQPDLSENVPFAQDETP
jgi:hypothetical protein